MNAKMILPLLLVGIVVAAGCIGQVSPTGGATQPDMPEETQPQEQEQGQEEPQETDRDLYNPPAGSPSVGILSPADGEVFEGKSAVSVRVDAENYRLVGSKSELRENEGQLHVIFEGPTSREQYIPLTVFSSGVLESGTYKLTVELVDNHRNPIGVSDSVTFTLAAPQ